MAGFKNGLQSAKNWSIKGLYTLAVVLTLTACGSSQSNAQAAKESAHPTLIFNQQDVQEMRLALAGDQNLSTTFGKAYASNRNVLDQQLTVAVNVPLPKDAGGGFTHEQHKRNYKMIYDLGVMYQLTQEAKYAEYGAAMLLAYAEMYPSLPLHPQKKEQSPGKLFWQSLNEAVWLVYSIIGYDALFDGIPANQRQKIEQGLFRPMVSYLSEQSPQTFNKVHNHGTWATAAVGMSGYVLGESEWVEKALYDLDKSGKGGFMRQLAVLFSPDGYYNEGPYYQRYALMPFVLFAQSIEQNEPERKIFEYRNGILPKAITSTIDLSYNKLFFPINDAIKDKGIDTIELVYGVSIAYGLTSDPSLLSIAKEQGQILLTGDGLRIAQAIDKGQAKPYDFASRKFTDGTSGEEGALVVMRANQHKDHQALVFKATAQGLGHGHFDKLAWLFYDNGHEVINDYGAARFLNVEAKYGGHYLPENNSYAKQTIAHSALVVDERSHFDGDFKVGNKFHPELHYFDLGEDIQVASATMRNAYKDLAFSRTQALVSHAKVARPFVIDILDVEAKNAHQLDLPVQYSGQIMDTSFEMQANTSSLSPLGTKNGYQHLWLAAQAKPQQKLAKVTWLNHGRFYTHATIVNNDMQYLFTKTGANDPDVNLRNESAFVIRVPKAKTQRFVSMLELHGEYNPSKEFTLASHSSVKNLQYLQNETARGVAVSFTHGLRLLVAINDGELSSDDKGATLIFEGKEYRFTGRSKLIELK